MNWRTRSGESWGRLGMKFDEDILYFIQTGLDGIRYSLFDLAIWKNGLAFKKIDFSDFGKPVIKIAELNNGITATTAYTNGKYSPEVHLTKGDMVFSWSGNPQTSIDVYWYDLPDGWLNQHIFKVTPNEEVVDKYFFYYVMKYLKPTFSAIATNKQTTGLGHVTIADLKRLSVVVPEKRTQKKIAEILKSIDDKININNEINKNLEQQAQALFRNQFLTQETLPDGWIKATLGEISLMGAGGDKPKTVSATQTENCPYPIYSNGISDEGLYGFTNEYKIKDESITVSARGTIGFVCLRHKPYTPIVRLVTLIPNMDVLSAKYLYLWLKNSPIHGTGTTQQQLTVPDFHKTEIILPTKEEMSSFTDTVTPLFEAMWANQDENTKLSKVRDSLLPKLMSGELDVSDIEL